MNTYTVGIKKGTVGLDKHNFLCARLTLEGLEEAEIQDLTVSLLDSENVELLTKLMNYTGAKEIQKLKSKQLRVIIDDYAIWGFGHPTEDKFFAFTPDGVGAEATEAIVMDELMDWKEADYY